MIYDEFDFYRLNYAVFNYDEFDYNGYDGYNMVDGL